MRKLASIQKVKKINNIPETHSLDKIEILGWEVVAKRDLHKEGDLVLFLEIDSFLPEEDPRFSFMSPYKFRVKTQKIRGVVSQGLIIPLSDFHELLNKREGDDVTDLLGVKKWEPPQDYSKGGEVRGAFPYIIPQTDEERIQTYYPFLKGVKGPFIVTEKLEGTSFTAYFTTDIKEEYNFGVCSRNLELREGPNIYWEMIKKYPALQSEIHKIGYDIAIQGEIIGPKVQGNIYNLKDRSLRIFTIYNLNTGDRLKDEEATIVCGMLGLQKVPFIEEIDGFYTENGEVDIKRWVEYSKGKSSIFPSVNREGIVVRNRDNPKISFKVINPDYLLKEGNKIND